MFAKNHFGSNTRSSAAHQNNGLVDPYFYIHAAAEDTIPGRGFSIGVI